jgi:hypothetical protein
LVVHCICSIPCRSSGAFIIGPTSYLRSPMLSCHRSAWAPIRGKARVGCFRKWNSVHCNRGIAAAHAEPGAPIDSRATLNSLVLSGAQRTRASRSFSGP